MLDLFSFSASSAGVYATAPCTVIVPDPEYQRDARYSGLSVSQAGVALGEVWRGPGLTWCWRTAKEYGHTQSQQDAIHSVVRQAGQRT